MKVKWICGALNTVIIVYYDVVVQKWVENKCVEKREFR